MAKDQNGWHNIDEDGWGVSLTYSNTERAITSDVCTSVNGKEVVEEYDMDRRNPSDIDYLVTSSNFLSRGNLNTSFGETVESLEIVPNLNIPANAIKSWDVSVKNNGTVMAWYTDVDNDNLVELYIGGKDGVTANPNSSYYFSRYKKIGTIKNLKILDMSSVTTVLGMFEMLGRDSSVTEFELDMTGWDTSKITVFSIMFSSSGPASNTCTKYKLIGTDGFDTSSATTMTEMFGGVGRGCQHVDIGNLSSWDTTNVTNMTSMFFEAAVDANTMASFGSLTIHDASIGGNSISHGMFAYCKLCSGTLNIKGNPTQYASAFDTAATRGGAQITVNYSRNTTNIDRIINTKRYGANIVKGELLD